MCGTHISDSQHRMLPLVEMYIYIYIYVYLYIYNMCVLKLIVVRVGGNSY